MKISMNALVQIWMSPVYARLNLGAMEIWYALFGVPLLLTELGTFVIYVSKSEGRSLTIFPLVTLSYLGIWLFLIAFVWFFMLSQYVLKQYSPANAKLTPRSRRHLQLAFLLPMIVFSLLASIAYYFFEDEFSILPAAYCALMMFATISMWRGFMGLIFFVGMLQMPDVFKRYRLESAFQRVDDFLFWGTSWSLFMLAMILVTMGLYWFFAINEKNLFRLYRQDTSFTTQLAAGGFYAKGIGLATSGFSGQWMDYCIRRQSQRKDVKKVSSSLLPLCFGPRSYWTSIFLQSLFVIAVLVVFICVFDLLRDKPPIGVFGYLSTVLYSLFGLTATTVYGLVFFQTIYQTRAEQGLVGLSPLSGNGKYQDRVFRRYFIRQFLILFAINFLCCVALYFAFEENRKGIATAMLFVTCQMPLLLAIADDYPGMRAANDHFMKAYVGSCAVLFLVFSYTLSNLPANTVWIFITIIVGGTLIIFQMASRSKPDRRTFPVGRAV